MLVFFEQRAGQRAYVGQVQFFVLLHKAESSSGQQGDRGAPGGDDRSSGAAAAAGSSSGAAAAGGGSSGSGSDEGAGDEGQGERVSFARFAMVRWYACRQWDEPDLADLLLECKQGDFMAGRGNAVPLQLIESPVHVHRRTDGTNTWLSFVPLVSRSNRVGYRGAIPEM